MRLLLIRHGQTPANVLGSLDTAQPGPGLTELGRRQARAVPAALGEHPIDAVYSSTLVRTQLTAAPLLHERGLDLRVRDGVQEIEAGDLEGLHDRASQLRYLETVVAWGRGGLDQAMPGGPDGNDFFARFDGAIADIASDHDGTVALVNHGAAIRAWVAGRSHNITPEFAATNHLDNTAMVVLEGDPDAGWTATSWGEAPLGGHVLEDPGADDPTGEGVEPPAHGR